MGGGDALKGNLWLIALTDGEPMDTEKEAQARAQLQRYCEDSNHLLIIAISGEVSEDSAKRFRDLTAIAQRSGGNGIFIAAEDEKDDSAIRDAFDGVREALIDVGGITQV